MAKVFISCGQSTPAERVLAKEINDWFLANNFDPYVAINTQNLSDVNSGIINELKLSDYYVFIDFKRDLLEDAKYRGSIFTNQELAIAYVLGIEEAIFLKHEDVKLEGITQYLTSNAVVFKNDSEIIYKLKEMVKERRWTNEYSRHLILDSLELTDNCCYTERGQSIYGKILIAKIRNKRSDVAAFNTVAHLEFIENNNNKYESPEKNLLKVSGQTGYNQIIWPLHFGKFDLLIISENPSRIYLNTSTDISPKTSIINDAGTYILYYSVISEFYPRLDFSIEISYDDNIDNFEYKIIE